MEALVDLGLREPEEREEREEGEEPGEPPPGAPFQDPNQGWFWPELRRS
jgi:hypothetical protein